MNPADEKTGWAKPNGIFRGGMSSGPSRRVRGVTPKRPSRHKRHLTHSICLISKEVSSMKQNKACARCKALSSDLSYTVMLSAGLLVWTSILLRLWAAVLF